MKICVFCGEKFSSGDWKCPLCGKTPARKGGVLQFSTASDAPNEMFPSEGFQKLARLEEGSFWFRSRNRLIQWAFRKYFPSALNFFEVGCGTGYVLSGMEKAFPNTALFGSEIYPEGLVFAAQRLDATELVQMDARHIPFADEFDALGAFDVLEHIPEDEEVLRQIYRAVRPDGGILLTVPQHRFLWSEVDEYARHVRRYSASELKDKVERAGFRVVRTSSFVFFLLPLMALSRFFQKKTGRKFDSEAEYRIPPALNFVLEKILRFELLLIRMGFDLPFGGSLFMVARKV